MVDKEVLAHEWYFANVNQEKLDKDIEASVVYFRGLGERGKLTIWAHEVVGRGYRKSDAVRVFLDYILYHGNKHYYIKDKNAPKCDEVMADFREVKRLVTNDFNEYTKLSGRFKVDYHGDGSLGVFYVTYV